MIRTDPAGDMYRRGMKRSRLFVDAIYTIDGVDHPLKAQKQWGETVRQVGGLDVFVSGVRAIVDPADLPGEPRLGDRIRYVKLAETYVVREFREIGDGFIEIQLDL